MKNNSVNLLEFVLMVQKEMSLRDIFLDFWAALFVLWSRTICAILVEDIMRNNSVNFI